MKEKAKNNTKEKKNEDKKKSKSFLSIISRIYYVILYIILNIFYYVFYVFLYEIIIRNLYLFIKKHFKDICLVGIIIGIIYTLFVMKNFLNEFKIYNENNKKNLEIINQQITNVEDEIDKQEESLNQQREDTDKKIEDLSNKIASANEAKRLKEEQERLKRQQEEKQKEITRTASVTSRSSTIERSTNTSGEWTTYNVSAYCSCAKCCGKTNGITASGARATSGVTIAAPSNYAFGTKIYLEGMGTYTVQDRGGAITGNRIDVYFDNHNAALAFGRRQVKGYVVK